MRYVMRNVYAHVCIVCVHVAAYYEVLWVVCARMYVLCVYVYACVRVHVSVCKYVCLYDASWRLARVHA